MQKSGLNLWHRKDFFAPTPSVRQPLFETSDLGGCEKGRVAPVRFGYGLGMERFERFRFLVPAVLLRRGFLCVSVQFNREDGSASGFGS